MKGFSLPRAFAEGPPQKQQWERAGQIRSEITLWVGMLPSKLNAETSQLRCLSVQDVIASSKALGFRPAGRVGFVQEPEVHCPAQPLTPMKKAGFHSANRGA